MPMNYLPATKKRLPDRILREFKGVNRLDKYSIGDGYATSEKNITSDAYPALSVRPGYSIVGGGALPAAILGQSAWKNTELHVITNGAWYKLSGGLWSISLATGLSSSAMASFANFKGGFPDIYLIMMNGVDAPRVYNGTGVSTLPGAPATGNYVISYSNRVFCVVGNLLYASGLNLATDWTSTGNDSSPYQISVDTIDGETISALAPGIGHVTIFKPNSMHELYGSSPSDVRVEPITFEVGAINNMCVVTLNSMMYFIHRTGIYRYGGGTRPARDFSQPVQAFIDEMNVLGSAKCCAGTDGQKIYFSIPSALSSSNDVTLVYDPKMDQWDVYRDFQPQQFTQTTSSFYIGMSDGRVVTSGGTTDNGSAVSWEWISKPFGADSYNQKIRWTRMWILCDVPDGSSLGVFVSPSPSGDADWVSVGSISGSAAIQNKRIMLQPSAAMSNFLRIRFVGSGPCKIHEWDRSQIEFPIV